MRILHTSDWHLGVTNGPVSRGPDHDLFLDWLTRTLEDHTVDALVVAGDVFDSMQPSAEALTRYYRFLAGVGRTGVRQVVIVGGNHDSASRLDAPAEVLQALQVHVVGGLAGSIQDERALVPLQDRAGIVRAVALAVPYVHEFRLGVRTTDPDHAAVRRLFTERFTRLYADLADRARASFPGLPLVATGHLTLGPAAREDYPQEIHQVGRIEGLPPSVLDPRLQYAALGHIHRSYPVAGGRGWYAGSPLPISLPEARTPRRVLLVDLDPDPDGTATVTPVDVPSFRALRELRGSPADLLAGVRSLTWSEPLPPLLYGRAVSDQPEPLLAGEIHAALAAFPEANRPVLVELWDLATPLRPADEEATPTDLRELTPADVFTALCRARGVTDTEALEAAFADLATLSEEDLVARVARITEGRP